MAIGCQLQLKWHAAMPYITLHKKNVLIVYYMSSRLSVFEAFASAASGLSAVHSVRCAWTCVLLSSCGCTLMWEAADAQLAGGKLQPNIGQCYVLVASVVAHVPCQRAVCAGKRNHISRCYDACKCVNTVCTCGHLQEVLVKADLPIPLLLSGLAAYGVKEIALGILAHQ